MLASAQVCWSTGASGRGGGVQRAKSRASSCSKRMSSARVRGRSTWRLSAPRTGRPSTRKVLEITD